MKFDECAVMTIEYVSIAVVDCVVLGRVQDIEQTILGPAVEPPRRTPIGAFT